MSKIEEVRSDMMAALKAGDKPRKDALSLLLAALKAKAIDKREDLTEEEENAVVYRQIKEAQETLETAPADRTELAEECRYRIQVWSQFAPQRMDKEQVRSAVREYLDEIGLEQPTPKDMGRIMKPLMAKLQGAADGALVSQALKEIMEQK